MMDAHSPENEPAAQLHADRHGLERFLRAHNLSVIAHEHQAVFHVSDSSALYEQIAGAHTKNLFLKDKKKRYFLISALHNTEIDLKQLHKTIGAAGRLSFGSADKLEAILGVRPGSVSAFALMNDRQVRQVSFILDHALLVHDTLNFHPLTNDATFTISQANFFKFCQICAHNPRIVDFRTAQSHIVSPGMENDRAAENPHK